MVTLATLPVYSKLATDPLPPELQQRLPAGRRLSEHQLETYLALAGNRHDVVVNTAMTGDGKSLAGYLPALVNDVPLLALYPTNELARDQEIQLQGMRSDWGGRFRFERLSAALLDEMVASAGLTRKLEALEQTLANREVVLTNPDIFHYIAQFYYTRQLDAPDRLFGRRLVQDYDQFVFDEFHIFQAPQVVSVVNALLLIREVAGTAPLHTGGRKRFLFLSATPGELLCEYLRRAEFDVHLVASDGRYLHTDDGPDSSLWRRILHGTDISFDTASAEEWVELHLEDQLLAFFRAHAPGAKGAIIVNSVAAAHRLAARLEPVFRREGLTVTLNTGLTSEALRKVSRDSDLLVGTSTVDVGVDFRINLLIFESSDAATFLQRLGRLGRHDDDGRGHKFERFQAHALVPNFVLERLSLAHLAEGGCYTREELAAAVRLAYPTPARFDDYAQKWGWVQCAHVFRELAQPTVRDTYAETRRKLHDRYWNTFHFNVGRKAKEYKELWAEQRPLLEEAQTFRGGSPLQCGLINLTEPYPHPVQRYNLLGLVANADLSWLEREEFEAELAKRGLMKQFSLDELVAAFRLHGFVARRRPLTVLVEHPVNEWPADRLGRPLVLDKIALEAEGLDWLNALNRTLRRRKLVVTLCLTPSQELRRRLYLPPLFELYDFRSPDGSAGAIAFARQALLLNVALERAHFACGEGRALIF